MARTDAPTDGIIIELGVSQPNEQIYLPKFKFNVNWCIIGQLQSLWPGHHMKKFSLKYGIMQ